MKQIPTNTAIALDTEITELFINNMSNDSILPEFEDSNKETVAAYTHGRTNPFIPHIK